MHSRKGGAKRMLPLGNAAGCLIWKQSLVGVLECVEINETQREIVLYAQLASGVLEWPL